MIEVILKVPVDKLGQVGKRVRVKPGFARNYLLPLGKAVIATPSNIAAVEAHRAELEKVANELRAASEKRMEAIHKKGPIRLVANVSTGDKLYGSIKVADIVSAMNQRGTPVEKKEVHLSSGPIQRLGEYEVDLILEGDVKDSLIVTVVSEEK